MDNVPDAVAKGDRSNRINPGDGTPIAGIDSISSRQDKNLLLIRHRHSSGHIRSLRSVRLDGGIRPDSTHKVSQDYCQNNHRMGGLGDNRKILLLPNRKSSFSIQLTCF